MYLEQRVEKLEKQVAELIEILDLQSKRTSELQGTTPTAGYDNQGLSNSDLDVLEAIGGDVSDMRPAEEVKETLETVITHQKLKELFISKSKDDMNVRTKLKELLKSYGANIITDLNESVLSEIYNKVEGEF